MSKACIKTKSLKKCQNCQKIAKIGTLSLVFRVSRAQIIKILNLATKKDFTEKYNKLVEIVSKNFENHGFPVYHPSNNAHVTGPTN